MKIETDFEKVDWEGVQADFLNRLLLLRVCWRATQRQLAPALHAKMVEDLYLPALTMVAEFIACVDAMEECDVEAADG